MVDDEPETEGEAIDPGDRPLEAIPLSLDAMLDILARSHRRYVLQHLIEQADGVSSVEDVTRHVVERTAREHGKRPNHDDIQVNLLHHQIPKLSEAGLVEFDVRSQTLRYRPNERLEDLLARVEEFRLDDAPA